jgi:hypothetical protein
MPQDIRTCANCGKKFDYDLEGDKVLGHLFCGKCLANRSSKKDSEFSKLTGAKDSPLTTLSASDAKLLHRAVDAVAVQDAAFTKSFGKGLKRTTKDAGSPAFMVAQKKALKALERLDNARIDCKTSFKTDPKVQAAEKAYNESIKELKRVMRGKE